jgi:uncharacterized membrane protein YfcA
MPLGAYYILYSPAGSGVFIYNKQVNYSIGITMGIGNILGAWVATHVAVKRGAVFIRWFLLICVITFALKLLLFRSITEV